MNFRMRQMEMGGAGKMLQTITRMHERRKAPCSVPKTTTTTVMVTSPVDSYEDSSTTNTSLPPITKRRTTKFVRRREPTVDIRLLTAQQHDNTENHTVLGGYSTLEVKSDHTLKSHYTEKEDTDTTLCGWRPDEHFKLRQELDNYATQQYLIERGQLQSREKSTRLYSCRLNSRLSRKRSQYTFSHHDLVEGHIQRYKDSCSFSHLVITSKRPSNSDIPEQQSDSIQEITDLRHDHIAENYNDDDSYTNPVANRGTSRNGNKPNATRDKTGPYKLHSLATRLGVMESIREPHLLQTATTATPAGTPRPTPPSIVKKRAGMPINSKDTTLQEELLVCGPQLQKDNNNASNSQTNRGISAAKSPSKPPSRQQTARHFPPLTEPIKKKSDNSSTISLSKYLNVGYHLNNKIDNKNKLTTEKQQQPNDNKEQLTNKQDHLKSDSSSLSSISSTNYLVEEKGEEEEEERLLQLQPWSLYTIDPLDMRSSLVKDEVIQRKANSLGLTSHKWARDFIERGFMSGNISRKVYYDLSSRPSTRGDKNGRGGDKAEKEEDKEGMPTLYVRSYSSRQRAESSRRGNRGNKEGERRKESGKGKRGEKEEITRLRKEDTKREERKGETLSDRLQKLESVYKRTNSNKSDSTTPRHKSDKQETTTIMRGNRKKTGGEKRVARLFLTHTLNSTSPPSGSEQQRDFSSSTFQRKISSKGEREHTRTNTWQVRGEKFFK